MFGSLGAAELIVILVPLALFLLMLFALVDIVRGTFQNNDKLIWVLIVLFLPILGSILYFLIGSKRKI
ncbi:MAG TPA: PLD nuclease N-terminal domain-containing protein [Ignavibacteriales bacterium]|nr:PLD nuclease N-terminal domain-containing protein [Ignavibacteriales bacterium]